jgi:hypothetical protein
MTLRWSEIGVPQSHLPSTVTIDSGHSHFSNVLVTAIPQLGNRAGSSQALRAAVG